MSGGLTLLPGRRYLTGSGGANDVASSAAEVLMAAAQDRQRLVEKVGYVTAPGRAVRTVVSQLGVFGKAEAHGELVPTAYLPAAAELGLLRAFDPRRQFPGIPPAGSS